MAHSIEFRHNGIYFITEHSLIFIDLFAYFQNPIASEKYFGHERSQRGTKTLLVITREHKHINVN